MKRLIHSLATLILIAICHPDPALSLTKADYDRIGVDLPPNALVPKELAFVDEQGRSDRLGQYLTRPTIIIPADFTCQTLCGPALDYLITTLEKTGLKAGDQYRVLVVSLNPANSESDADALRQRSDIRNMSLNRAVTFARVDATARDQLTTSLGYSYIFDASANQFIHPEAAFIVRTNGHVSRALNGIGFTSDDLRLALVEASDGSIGTVRDRVRLICSAFDPSTGTYTVLVQRVLAISSAVAIAILFTGLSGLLLMERFARRP